MWTVQNLARGMIPMMVSGFINRIHTYKYIYVFFILGWPGPVSINSKRKDV